MKPPPRLISLGEPNESDLASTLASIAIEMDVPSTVVTSSPGESFESFDHGVIDWKELMETAHWMVNDSSLVNLGQSPAMAWSASMTFAELEGCRNVMLVDMVDPPELMPKTWGLVIGKMRQIHVLFFTNEAIEFVTSLEQMDKENFLSEVREKTMVPIVCGITEEGRAASVSHAMGDFDVDIRPHRDGLVWLAGFLKSLPYSGTGIGGIREAASWQ